MCFEISLMVISQKSFAAGSLIRMFFLKMGEIEEKASHALQILQFWVSTWKQESKKSPAPEGSLMKLTPNLMDEGVSTSNFCLLIMPLHILWLSIFCPLDHESSAQTLDFPVYITWSPWQWHLKIKAETGVPESICLWCFFFKSKSELCTPWLTGFNKPHSPLCGDWLVYCTVFSNTSILYLVGAKSNL